MLKQIHDFATVGSKIINLFQQISKNMCSRLDTERRIASLREASARDEDEHSEKMLGEQEVKEIFHGESDFFFGF